jgi:hypothetical protein
MHCAISSGRPARLCGYYAAKDCHTVRAKQFAPAAMHRSVDDSGTHNIDPDSLWRQLGRDAGRQSDHPVLRGDVWRKSGTT